MKELMPDAEFHMIPLSEVVFGSKLGLRLQTGIMVPLRNRLGSAAKLLLP